jgi:cullin-associated NEDD8-dissociated protein 1
MPVLMGLISGAAGSPKQQYLLLQALGEVISSIASVGQEKMDLAEGDRNQVLALLLSSCDGEEECRNVVAECLGRLALLHPVTVLAALDEKASDPLALAHSVDAHLGPVVPRFLGMMADPDRNVRKAAVVSLSAVAHHKPVLVASHLETLLPLLYQQTVVRPELVRVVDLGPFKHTIDDGLELRKAAFECLDILLDACRPQIEATTFMAHLEGGLQVRAALAVGCGQLRRTSL